MLDQTELVTSARKQAVAPIGVRPRQHQHDPGLFLALDLFMSVQVVMIKCALGVISEQNCGRFQPTDALITRSNC
jgi:hypothetical protein